MKVGDVVAERFELVAHAGSGGMADVFRGRDLSSGEPVAIKVMRGDSAAARRFVREARVLSMLQHPRIVRFVACGNDDAGHFYLVMEWLEGEDLHAHLRRTGRLSVDDTVALGRGVADALAAAHQRGIVHRDIKPSNLFLVGGEPARVKIVDFGIARVEVEQVLTLPGMAVGTPGYMAPEQALGETDVDARADVYALGCVLFRCLAGEPPFDGTGAAAVLAKIVLEDPPVLGDIAPDVPPVLEVLVSRMMEKARDLRPGDATGVSLALARLAGDGPTPATGDPPPTAEEELFSEVLALALGAGGTVTADTRRLPATALSGAEVRILSVVLAHPGPADARGVLPALEELAARHGARLARLADGTVLLAVPGATATEQALRAARAALALRVLLPAAPIALATGRALHANAIRVGEVIDRAAALLGAETPGIRLDDATAGLLPSRFDVGALDDGGLVLIGERELLDAARTLLGRPSPCVGRERELQVLEALVGHALAEPAAAGVLLVGEAGAGKSRLRHELLGRLGARFDGLKVFIGRGDPMRARAPFGVAADSLRHGLGLRDGERLAFRRARLRAEARRYLAPGDAERVGQFLGEMLGATTGAEPSGALRAARADRIALGDQIRRAFIDLLESIARRGPLLLVLEDLHWGDRPTLELASVALNVLAELPVVVLAIGRPEMRELLAGLPVERELHRVELGALRRSAAVELVRAALGDGIAEETVGRLVERAGGNPFFLEELIRAEAEGRSEALPATVMATVEARIAALAPEPRRLVRAASVLGETCWRGALGALLGAGAQPADVDGWLDLLCARELLVRRPETRFDAEVEYAFRHGLVREAAYGMLTGTDRALGHRLAAQWLEGAGESDASVLATHLEQAGLPDRALPSWHRAAEQALEANDLGAVIERVARGLGCGATGETRGALLGLRAEALAWKGENEEAERDAVDALALLTPGTAAWADAVAQSAIPRSKLARWDGVRELAAELTRGLPESADAETREAFAFALARVAQTLVVGSDRERAEALAAIASELTPESDRARAALLRHRAFQARVAGEHGTYLACNERAVLLYKAAGDLRREVQCRAAVGYALCELGAHPAAERALRAALAVADRIGMAVIAAEVRHGLGLVVFRLGRLAEARALEEHAIRAFHALGDRRLEGDSRLYLGSILLGLGELETAEREALLAMELRSALPLGRPLVLALLARIDLARGRAAGALSRAREAAALADDSLGTGSAIRLVLAEALLANGDGPGAIEVLAAARERLLERAAVISDAELRRSFLANVPDNARTLELAARLVDGA